MKKAFFLLLITLICCNTGNCSQDNDFPKFIAPNTEYYVTRIGKVPNIDSDSYRLEVKGFVESPKSLTLKELYAMPMKELPLTVECIGNSPNGPLLSTAIWKGFLLYDFLKSLGISEKATGVRYQGADGYYASHTLVQVKDNAVLVALYMNGEVIPPLHGFPVRILNPGYHGVKQPAWITTIELIDRPIKDYWEERGWDCSPPMAVDSVIFFPKKRLTVTINQLLKIGGAAFGGTRIAKVEVTIDRGQTWKKAEIVKRMDFDHVWIFWETELKFASSGNYNVNVRATDIHGNVQQETDPDRYDGTNDWPVLRVKVKK